MKRAIVLLLLCFLLCGFGGRGISGAGGGTAWIVQAGTNDYSLGIELTGNTSVVFPTAGTLQTTTGSPAGFVIASQAPGDLLYASSNSAWTRLAKGSNNSFLGINSAGTMNWYTNIQLDDSAAQFYSATASKGTLKVLLSGSTDGKLMTLASSQTDNRTVTLPDATATLTYTLASGSLALATSEINAGECQAVSAGTTNSVAATGVATTDVITFTPNATIKAVTGYTPATTGGLTITAFPTSGYVNFDVCNWTAAAVTPGAVTVNWKVVR